MMSRATFFDSGFFLFLLLPIFIGLIHKSDANDAEDSISKATIIRIPSRQPQSQLSHEKRQLPIPFGFPFWFPFQSDDPPSTTVYNSAPPPPVSFYLDSHVYRNRGAPKCWHDPGLNWRDPKLWSGIDGFGPEDYETFWEFCTAAGNALFNVGCKCVDQKFGLQFQWNSMMECKPEGYQRYRRTHEYNTLWAMCTVGCGCKYSQRRRSPALLLFKKGMIEAPDPSKALDNPNKVFGVPSVPDGYDPRFCSFPVPKRPFIVVLCGSKWLVLPMWNEYELEASRRNSAVRTFPVKMLPGQKIESCVSSSAGILVGSTPGEKDQCDWPFTTSDDDLEELMAIQRLKTKHLSRYDHLGVLMHPVCDYSVNECMEFSPISAATVLPTSACSGKSAFEQIVCITWYSPLFALYGTFIPPRGHRPLLLGA